MDLVDRNGRIRGSARDELGIDQAELERLCIDNLLNSSAEQIFFKDLRSRFLTVSAGWLSYYGGGRRLEEIIGLSDFDVFGPEHATAAFADERQIIATGEPLLGKVQRETFVGRADRWSSTTKLPLRDADGRIIGTFGLSRDVTEQIYVKQQLTHQVRHDPVTGLANRVAVIEQLTRSLATLERHAGRIGVMFVDLNGFKEINDLHGHELGDRLLTAVGRRMTLALRHGDTVARFGGDEFVVLAGPVRSEWELERLAERVREALLAPLLGDHGITVDASIGIASTDDPATTPDELLARADAAMYAGKRAGRGPALHYDKNLHDATRARPELLEGLRTAIARDELFLVHQPIVRLSDGSLAGVEALTRWRHPARGVLAPDHFISLAERHNLIGEIDLHGMDRAVGQLVAWQRTDPAWRERTISVNLSGQGLRDPRLVERVLSILGHHGVAPERLCVEITETAMIGEFDSARHAISCLRAQGVRIALDDFGTGFSTLAHLQQLEADVIKIDRSFVSRIGREPRDRKIVAAVTAMAHALGMSVVGEGVETTVERRTLAAVGCDAAQGYLFARPSEAPEIAALARRDFPAPTPVRSAA